MSTDPSINQTIVYDEFSMKQRVAKYQANRPSGASADSGFFMVAAGFRCTLEMCPPGLFCQGDDFGFKTEYYDDNGPEAYCVESGEYFWGGTDDKEVRRKLLVTPCVIQNA